MHLSQERAAVDPDLLMVLAPPVVIVRWRVALRQLVVRAIARQYRTTAFGLLWTLLVPLVTLAIYSFVFGVLMQNATGGTARFVLNLFSGLLVFWLMAQAMGEACGAVVAHTNLVKKAVFPLEIIPLASLGSAAFQALINLGILVLACAAVERHIPATALLLPLVFAPFLLLLMGLVWFLSAIGVYFRDLAQIVALVLTGALYFSPILYPLTRFGPGLQKLVLLNPVSYIVIQMQRVLFEGAMPSWPGLAGYTVVAWIVASCGLAFFNFARTSFADVL